MKFLRGFLSFIAFFLCLALFAATLATMLVADVRVITSRDNLKTIINQYITGSLESPAPGVNLAGGKVILFAENGEGEENALMEKLIESVYDTLSSQFGGEVPFTQEQVTEFVKDSTLPEFISEKAADIITDIYNGEMTATITGQEIKELIEENKPLIEETLDIKITSDIVESVTEMVEKADVTTKIQEAVSEMVGIPVTPDPENPDPENPGQTQAPEQGGDVGVGKPSLKPSVGQHESEGGIVGDVTAAVNNIKDLANALKNGEKVSLPVVLNTLRTVTTKNMLIACIGVCVILMLLIFLCKLNRWYAALRNCGVVYLLAGILLLIPVGAAQLLPMFIGKNSAIPLIQLVVNMTLSVSGGVALGGLLFIIIGSLSGSAVRRKARKKAEKEALAAAQLRSYVAVPTSAPVPTIEDILSADAPAEESAEAPAEEAVAESAEEPADETVAESVEEPAEEVVEEAPIAKEPAEESVAEPIEESVAEEPIAEEEPAEV